MRFVSFLSRSHVALVRSYLPELLEKIILCSHVSIGVWMLSSLHVTEGLLLDKIILVLHLWSVHILLTGTEVTRNHNYIMHCSDDWLHIIFFVWITRYIGIPKALSSLSILSLISPSNTSWWSLTLNSSRSMMMTPSYMHRYIIAFMDLSASIKRSSCSTMLITLALLNT